MSRAPLEITGERFGRLTALEKTEEKRHGAYVWMCQCDCGEVVYITAKTLNAGHTKSCGCLKKDAGLKLALDLTGQRFGQLTALERTERKAGSTYIWKCQCDCGNTAYVRASYLRMGKTKSCGCLRGKHPRKPVADTNRLNRAMSFYPTNEREQAVLQAYRDGMSYKQVGEQVGISASRVRQILLSITEPPGTEE